MTTGPKPLPSNLIQLRGVSGRNSAAAKAERASKDAAPAAPLPMTAPPPPPDKLTAQGKLVFNELAAMIHKRGAMADSDVHALCMYVDSYLVYESCMEVIRRDGPIDENGMRRPQVQVAREAHRECLRMLTEFGLTPSSRVRIRANG